MSLAVLIPSMDRAWALARVVENLHEATPEEHTAYFFVNDSSSAQELARLGERCWMDDGESWGRRINFGFFQTTEPYLFLGSDDLKFHPGWASAAMESMEQVDGVVSVNDMFNPRGTSALVSRHYIESLSGCADEQGVVVHSGYHHNFADVELFETAKKRGRFAYCETSVVEHLHWLAGKSKRDATYQRSDTTTELDRQLFHQRKHLWETLCPSPS